MWQRYSSIVSGANFYRFYLSWCSLQQRQEIPTSRSNHLVWVFIQEELFLLNLESMHSQIWPWQSPRDGLEIKNGSVFTQNLTTGHCLMSHTSNWYKNHANYSKQCPKTKKTHAPRLNRISKRGTCPMTFPGRGLRWSHQGFFDRLRRVAQKHKSLVLETSSSLTLLNSIDPLLPSTSQWCKELIHILTRYLMNFHLLRVWLLSPFPLAQDHWELSMMRCDHPVGQTVELEDWQQCKAGNNGANVSTDTLSETHLFPCQSAFHCTCSWKWMETHGNSTQTNQK